MLLKLQISSDTKALILVQYFKNFFGGALSGRAIISSSLHFISGDTPFYPSPKVTENENIVFYGVQNLYGEVLR